MKKIIASFALVLGLTAGATLTGTSAATAAPTTIAKSGNCTNWQYKVKSKSGVYGVNLDSNHHSPFTVAYKGYYVNTSYPNNFLQVVNGVTYAYGTIYTSKKDYVSKGLINKSRLDYVTCW